MVSWDSKFIPIELWKDIFICLFDIGILARWTQKKSHCSTSTAEWTRESSTTSSCLRPISPTTSGATRWSRRTLRSPSSPLRVLSRMPRIKSTCWKKWCCSSAIACFWEEEFSLFTIGSKVIYNRKRRINLRKLRIKSSFNRWRIWPFQTLWSYFWKWRKKRIGLDSSSPRRGFQYQFIFQSKKPP